MIYIFCDIQGTYNKLEDNDKIELVELLKQTNKKIIFSFISTANIQFVKHEVEDFKKYIEGTNITLGVQLAHDQYINYQNEIKPVPCDYSKAIKMIYFQESLDYQNENIEHTIYIDDHPNMFPLIFTMDNNIQRKLDENKLKFTIIEKNQEGYNYCHDSIESKNVEFISIENDKFLLEGLKQLLK